MFPLCQLIPDASHPTQYPTVTPAYPEAICTDKPTQNPTPLLAPSGLLTAQLMPEQEGWLPLPGQNAPHPLHPARTSPVIYSTGTHIHGKVRTRQTK